MDGSGITVRRMNEAFFRATNVERPMRWFYTLLVLLLITLGIGALFMGVVYLKDALAHDKEFMRTFAVFTLAVGMLFISYGVGMGYYFMARVPFIAFNDGFFAGVLTPAHLLAGTVPARSWGQIRSVEVRRSSYGLLDVSNLFIVRHDSKTMKVASNPEMLECMNILAGRVPHRLGHTVWEYLIDSDRFRYHPDSTGSLTRNKQQHWVLLISLTGLSVLAFSIFSALPMFLYIYIRVWRSSSIFATYAIALMCFLSVPMLIPTIRDWYLRRVLFGSRITSKWLKPRTGPVNKLFLRVDRRIGRGRIIEIRRTLYPLTFSDHAVVRLDDSREYEAEVELFKRFAEDPAFKRDGDILVNRNPPRTSGGSVAHFSVAALTLIGLLVAVLYGAFFVLFLLLAMSSTRMALVVFIVEQALLFLFFLTGAALLIYYMIQYMERARRLTGTTVALVKKGVYITDREGTTRRLAIRDISKVEKVDGRILNFTRLTSSKGVFDLPMEVRDALEIHLRNRGRIPDAACMTPVERFRQAPLLSYLADAEDGPDNVHQASGAKRIGLAGGATSGVRSATAGLGRRVSGQGALWYRESAPALARRRRGHFLKGLFRIGAGILLGAAFLLLISLSTSRLFDSVIVLMAFIVLVILGMSGIDPLLVGMGGRALSFYSGGLSTGSPLLRKTMFYPWGRFSGIVERKDLFLGPVYVLEPGDVSVERLLVPKFLPGVSGLMERVRSNVARTGYRDISMEGAVDMRALRIRRDSMLYPVLVLVLCPLAFGLFFNAFREPFFVMVGLGALDVVAGSLAAGFTAVILHAIALTLADHRRTIASRMKLLPVIVSSSLMIVISLVLLAVGSHAGVGPGASHIALFVLMPSMLGATMLVAQITLVITLVRGRSVGAGTAGTAPG